jgi:Galactoside-binding lectin/Glycosyl transferase family 2
MIGLTVCRYPDGVSPPVAVELSGKHPWNTDPDDPDSGRRSPLNILWLDSHGNVALHFNPRPEEGAVVLNSYIEGASGDEMVVTPYPFSPDSEAPIRLRFEILDDCFRVFANGSQLCVFAHRRPPSDLREVRASTFLWRLDREGRAFAPLADRRPRRGDDAATWVIAEHNPPRWRRRPPSFRFFAVLGTWMEEDVVAATVANCLQQGCERVYLVDNDSPDRTVERALAAGAHLARSFSTERYSEAARVAEMQAVVDEVSAAEDVQHIWWLWVDADEFHHGPGGLTLLEYLGRLDRRFRIVGARLFNHLPTDAPAYVEGRHPLDFQPLCYEVPRPNCQLGHSNHPLQRWDREGPRMICDDGAHWAKCDELLREPLSATFFHHFPYREEAFTRQRLTRLLGVGDGDGDRIGANPHHYSVRLRIRSLDAIYQQRWRDVVHFPPLSAGYVPELRRWDDWVKPGDRKISRWY